MPCLPVPLKDELKNLYVINNLSTREIAEFYGVSKTTVRRWIHHHNIPMMTTWQKRKDSSWQPPSRETLYDLIWNQRLNYETAAAILNCHSATITFWLRQYNIETPDRQWSRLDHNGFLFPDKNELESLLLEQQLTLTELAKYYGCNRRFLSHYIQDLGIEIPSPGYQGKYYQCIDGDIVRSSYERRVDNWLFENNIPHQYEPVLPWGHGYRADFLALGHFIEVWGMGYKAEYQARKRYKLAMYKQYNLPLIEIPRWKFRPQHDFTKPLQILLAVGTPLQLTLLGF